MTIELKPLTPYLTYDPEDLNKICARLKGYDNTADTEHFYTYMRIGMLNHKIFPFVVYNNDEMVACAVLSISQSPMYKEEVLYIQWAWINPAYPNYWKKGMEFLCDIAKEFKLKKIVANTKRLPQAFQRKFGFVQTDAIIEKELE